MRDHHRRIVDWLTAQGATAIRLDPYHKHVHIHFDWRGVAQRYMTAAPTSDSRRASKNAIGNLRHILGLVEMQKRIGERRQIRTRTSTRQTQMPKLTERADWRDKLPNLWPNRGRRFVR